MFFVCLHKHTFGILIFHTVSITDDRVNLIKWFSQSILFSYIYIIFFFVSVPLIFVNTVVILMKLVFG